MLLNVVQIQTVAIILILSYFIGNFQTAVLYSKRFLHDDVRQHGSGNPGASNMTRVFGTKWGVITFLGDAFKCFLGVALGAYLGQWWGIAVQNSALDLPLGAYIGGLGVVGILAYGYQLVGRVIVFCKNRSLLHFTFLMSYVGLFLMSQVNPGEFCPMPYAALPMTYFALMETGSKDLRDLFRKKKTDRPVEIAAADEAA